MELEEYKKLYNITEDQIKKNMLRPGENAYRTSLKELIGQKYIARNRVFKRFIEDDLHYEYLGYKKVTDKRKQKAGADYEVFYNDDGVEKKLYVDLKSLQGPHYEQIPLELEQNGIWTNGKNKITDYHLYIVHDDGEPRHKWIPYDTIVKECAKYRPQIEHNGNVCFFKWADEVYTSNNGSGKYIKWSTI